MAGLKPKVPEADKRKIGERFNPYRMFEAGIYIPEQLCRYPGISHGAKLVWGRLKRYCGQNDKAYPSLAALGGELAMSKDQVRRYIRELQINKLIQVDYGNKQYYKNGAGGTANYYFLWHSCLEDQRDPPLAELQGVPVAKLPAPTAGESASQRESLVKRVNASESGKRPAISVFNPSSFDNFDEPRGWEQARELRQMERDLPLEEIKKRAKAEAGSKRYKYTRILAERL